MKPLNPSLLLLLSALMISSPSQSHGQSHDDVAIPDGPYLGQTPPGATPEIFAPGIVSLNGRYEHSVSFSPDLDEIYFSAVQNKGNASVYFSKLENNKWTDLKKTNFTKGAINHEYEAFVSPSDKRIYFTAHDSNSPPKIWYANRVGPLFRSGNTENPT